MDGANMDVCLGFVVIELPMGFVLYPESILRAFVGEGG